MTLHDPERRFAIDVVQRLREAGFLALWAGGCVRDLLRGHDPSDFDVATNATPEQVRELFGRNRTLAVGESFGVVIVLGPKHHGETLQVEVATFRSEGPYLDGRRPEHVAFCTPEEDAQRRDFTINGMFYDPITEEVIDYVGGQRDLQEGIVRAIGDPHARMTEDKLRMLRAVRFAAAFEFELDSQTFDAIREMAHQVRVVSWERITVELRKMLLSPHRRRAMTLCERLGLLVEILPELEVDLPHPSHADDHSRATPFLTTLNALEQLHEPTFELALALLLRDLPVDGNIRRDDSIVSGSIEGVCRRMKLSNHERDRVTWLMSQQSALDEPASLSLAELKRLLVQPGATELRQLVASLRKVARQDDGPLRFVQEFLSTHSPAELDPPELIDGADLIGLGLTPGPEFRQLLDLVRTAQLNETLNTRAEAIELVQRHRTET